MDWYCENVIHGNLEIDTVYDSPTVLAFHHTKPFWEHHIVVVPKQHIGSMASPEAKNAALISEIMHLLSDLANDFEAQFGGCHIGTNVGSYQSTKHMHWYIHAGKRIRDEQGHLIDPENLE